MNTQWQFPFPLFEQRNIWSSSDPKTSTAKVASGVHLFIWVVSTFPHNVCTHRTHRGYTSFCRKTSSEAQDYSLLLMCQMRCVSVSCSCGLERTWWVWHSLGGPSGKVHASTQVQRDGTTLHLSHIGITERKKTRVNNILNGILPNGSEQN